MHITVSVRHEALTTALRERAELVLNRLGKIGDRAIEGTTVFDTVGGEPWVELKMHCAGGRVLVATAEADDHKTALDIAERRMRRQLRRLNTRPLAARHAATTN